MFYRNRDVLLSWDELVDPIARSTLICADVVSIGYSEVTLPLKASGTFSVYTRVVTSNGPVNIKLQPETHHLVAFVLYASTLNHPISVSCGDRTHHNLLLGPDSGHVGMTVTVEKGEIKGSHETSYSELAGYPSMFRDNLRSQLRIAASIAWNEPAIAYDLAYHVVTATSDTSECADLNAPALSLVQQLAGRVLSGANTSYAPSLPIEAFFGTLQSAIAATDGFQQQYDRFCDAESGLEDKIAASKAMLRHARISVAGQSTLGDEDVGRFTAACQVLADCQEGFFDDQKALEAASDRFQKGIKAWKKKMEKRALFAVFGAIVGKVALNFFTVDVLIKTQALPSQSVLSAWATDLELLVLQRRSKAPSNQWKMLKKLDNPCSKLEP